jgi:hypothetical protein
MLECKSLYPGTLAACLAIATLQADSALAAPTDATFYDAALCNPPIP